MKICVITTSFPRFKGDYSGLFVFRLCQSLTSINLEVDVVAPADSETVLKETMERSVVHRFCYFIPKSFQKISYGPGGIPSNLKRNPSLYLIIPFFMIRFLMKTLSVSKNADLIHAQWLYSGVIASIVKAVRGTPFVLTLRGSDVLQAKRNKWAYWLALSVLRRASFITTVNQEMKDWVIGQGISNVLVSAIKNGVGLNRINKGSHFSKKCRFIFVGNLVSGKGVHILIEALASFFKIENNFSLSIVGDGEDLDILSLLIQKKNLDHFVTFLGIKPHDEVQALMHESDCLVLPSFSEGISNVVLEAMASGLPVVASRLPGLREVVKEGETGFLVEPGDIEGLAKKLLEIIQNPEGRRKMGQNAYRNIVSMNLSWDDSARQYLEVYQKVCVA